MGATPEVTLRIRGLSFRGVSEATFLSKAGESPATSRPWVSESSPGEEPDNPGPKWAWPDLDGGRFSPSNPNFNQRGLTPRRYALRRLALGPSCRVLETRPFSLSQTRISPDSSFAATRRRKADTDKLSPPACFRKVLRVRSSKPRLVFFCNSFVGTGIGYRLRRYMSSS